MTGSCSMAQVSLPPRLPVRAGRPPRWLGGGGGRGSSGRRWTRRRAGRAMGDAPRSRRGRRCWRQQRQCGRRSGGWRRRGLAGARWRRRFGSLGGLAAGLGAGAEVQAARSPPPARTPIWTSHCRRDRRRDERRRESADRAPDVAIGASSDVRTRRYRVTGSCGRAPQQAAPPDVLPSYIVRCPL